MELTKLQIELQKKIDFLSDYKILPKYAPRRVEPGVASDLYSEEKWSKYLGESLFINNQLLKDNILRDCIFCREAFLLLVPKNLREKWWIRILANFFPFCLKNSVEFNSTWERFLIQCKFKKKDISYYKKIAISTGTEGFVQALRQGLEMTRPLMVEKKHLEYKELSKNEFLLLLDQIYDNTIGLSDNSIEILKLSLAKQTIKPKIIEKHTNKKRNYISYALRNMQKLQILSHTKEISFQAIGLTNYHLLLFLDRAKIEKIRKNLLKLPYLFSLEINSLSYSIAKLEFMAPNNKRFLETLKKFSLDLIENNLIKDFYYFTIDQNFTNYLFKYFDHKTKTQDLNLNNVAIDYNLLSRPLHYDFYSLQKELGNFVIFPQGREKILSTIDFTDLEILNQILYGNQTRRAIQKHIKKDMNDIVARLQNLEKNEVIYDNVAVNFPDSDGFISLYIENKELGSMNLFLADWLKQLSFHLPHAKFSQITGAFKGVHLQSKLPYSGVIQLTDLLKKFLPNNIQILMLLGEANISHLQKQIPLKKRNNGEWVLEEEDFTV